jgi:solute carrier family 25 (peroxisomal adenine nucleotide transporter), member 17
MATTAKSVAAQSTQDVPATAAAQQSDNVAHALAGAGGGILSTALTYVTSDNLVHLCLKLTITRYPLITLSTRAQVESKKADTSALDAVRQIIKREGIAGLYSGIDSALFGISLTNFVYYYCTVII